MALRAGFVGTGYIADFHASALKNVIDVDLVSVCDSNLSSARSFADRWKVHGAYANLEEMLNEQEIDVLHVLVPADQHFKVASTAVNRRVHLFIEKPFCISPEEGKELIRIAKATNVVIGINHNMLFSEPFERIRRLVKSGDIGSVRNLTIEHLLELPQLRFGPLDSWVLREPGNVLLELGPHIFSMVYDLLGDFTPDLIRAERPFRLFDGRVVHRRWRLYGHSAAASMAVTIDVGPGLSHRVLSLQGLSGRVVADFDANVALVDKRSHLDFDLDRYIRGARLSSQIRKQSARTLLDYVLSKADIKGSGSPYQLTFNRSVGSFYRTIRGAPLDSRLSSEFGLRVVNCCLDAAKSAKVDTVEVSKNATSIVREGEPPLHSQSGSVLVLGASGFIGKELVRQLLAQGYKVRALSRNVDALRTESSNGALEVVPGDIRDAETVRAAMCGVEYVFHLANFNGKVWQDYINNTIMPAKTVAHEALAAGVKRLIYTGTIDSYYSGSPSAVITDHTPLDRNIKKRNYYARAKAAAEDILMKSHHENRLPVVILRPGIVIGRGGNPFHWGVGRWRSESACEIWGRGTNKLPFVLVSDVVAGLLRAMRVKNVEGKAYNLVGPPLLTASEYIKELGSRAGLKIEARFTPSWKFFLEDLAKWVVKCVVGHPDKVRIPSYYDWKSRTHQSSYDSSIAMADLNWKPVSDKESLIVEGVGGSVHSWRVAAL